MKHLQRFPGQETERMGDYDREINRGHTIASDGVVYLTDDTENNRILVFEKEDGRFIHTQTFSDIGIRPHYIVYDETSGYFYALSSMTGELYVFSREKNSTRMGLKEVRSIEKLNGVYVRSFTIIGKGNLFCFRQFHHHPRPAEGSENFGGISGKPGNCGDGPS